MNDFELKATTHRRFPNARSLLRAASRLAVLATAVLIVASVSNTAARADTPVKRDIWNIGNPLVLPITPAQLAEDRRFRQAAGFRSDDAYIAALYDQVARGALPGASRNWAALLTADEAANMTGRQQLAEIVGPAPLGADTARLTAFGRILSSHIDEFGGMYFDQLADGAVVVLVTARVGDYIAALAPTLGSHADHLRVFAVAHTYQELMTLTQRLAADSAWLKAQGVVLSSFGPDAVSNTVVASVPAATDAVKAVLQGRYPGAPLRVVEGPPVKRLGANDRQAPPMMGGLQIWNVSVVCSSGFIVNSGGSTPTYAVLSAGHCGGASSWLQGSTASGNAYLVGDTTTVAYNEGGDAEVIPLAVQTDASHSPFVYISTTTSCGVTWPICTDSHNMRVISGFEAATTIGEVTCASRTQEADEVCGFVKDVNRCLTSSDNVTTCFQVFADLSGIHGDSGGPYYQPQVSGTSVAQGILSGSISGANFTNWTSYTQITAAFAAISAQGGESWSIY